MNTLLEHSCNVLVIGNGVTGPSLVLRLTDQHQVVAPSKDPITEGSTFYAQGDIAAVFDETDSIDSHMEDTLIAGAGIYDRRVVEFVTSNARSCMQWLIDQGVLFDTHIQSDDGESYHLTCEDGHSHRRIPHAVNAADREVEAMLVGKVQNHLSIRVLERSNTVDPIVSDKTGLPGTRWTVSAWIWNRNKETIETCHAKAVVLVTGGASKVYQYTTNSNVFSDDGIAMVWCAGYRVTNLESNQFHPTAPYHPQARNFLLVEVLRGKSVCLKRPDDARFMPDFDEHSELAPCDIVARTADHEMKRLGTDCAFLDINRKPADFIRQHLPMIYERLLRPGIDLMKEPVLITPAAHYTYGGVMVNDHGRTDVDGLYATGEMSYTGLHDASHVTSSSLLECLVHGWSVVEDTNRRMPCARGVSTLPPWDESHVENPDEQVVIQHSWHELRLFMWDYVGTVYTTKRLARVLWRITMLQQEIDKYYAHFCAPNNLLELRNLVWVTELIVRCAMICEESRGLHFTLGYPELPTHSGPSILSAGNHYINR